MKSIARFIRATLVGGILYLVPLMVLLILLQKAHGISSKIVRPISQQADVGRLLAILLILFFCFLAGLFARTNVARRITTWIEDAILSKVPAYTLIKSMAESMTQTESAAKLPPVLVRIEDAWQMGFLIERINESHVAVFIPGVPDVWSGSLYYMTNDRIRALDLPVNDVRKVLRRIGYGSADLLRARLREDP